MGDLTRWTRALVAALVAPAWIAGGRWRELLDPSPSARPGAAVVPVAAAERAVRWLSHVPFGPWRATCLYRSVAGCLLLRWSGVDAVLRLGVGGTERGSAAAAARLGVRPTTLAHAWIESAAGEVLYGDRTGWAPLQ